MRQRNVKNKKEIIDKSNYIIKNPIEFKGVWKKVFNNNYSNSFYCSDSLINNFIEWIKEHIETYQKNGIVILDWDTLSDPRNLLKILGGDE